MVKTFLYHSNILKKLNNTHITLIPKKKTLKELMTKDLLFFVLFHIFILKRLANRLHTIISKLISPLQGAFVPNKGIHDNILIAHEILFALKKKYKGKCCMAI